MTLLALGFQCLGKDGRLLLAGWAVGVCVCGGERSLFVACLGF